MLSRTRRPSRTSKILAPDAGSRRADAQDPVPGIVGQGTSGSGDIELSERVLKDRASKRIPRWQRFASPARRLVNDVESVIETDLKPTEARDEPDTPKAHRCEVIQSWVEHIAEGGDHEFYLNIVPREDEDEKYGPDNVEWIHQEEDVKSFSKFKHLLSTYALKDCTPGTDQLALGLLTRVQNLQQKPYAGGFYLNHCAMSEEGVHDQTMLSSDETPLACTFINFPYFSLDSAPSAAQYDAPTHAGDRPFPTRSLLQTRYRLESTERRDLEQSVANLSIAQLNSSIQPPEARMEGPRKRLCRSILNVPQAWCLLVSGDKLITSAPMSHEDVYGSTLTIKDSSKSDNFSVRMVRIVLEDGNEEKKYVFPINYCDWWFGLCDKYQQIMRDVHDGKNRIFDFVIPDGDHDERVINDRNWVEHIRLAKADVLEIRLKERLPSSTNSSIRIGSDLTQIETNDPGTDDRVSASTVRNRPGVRKSVGFAEPLSTQITSTDVLTPMANPKDAEHPLFIPFFEWPLRKFEKHPQERSRAARLHYIMRRVLDQQFRGLRNKYVQEIEAACRSQGRELSEISKHALVEITIIKGLTIEECNQKLGRITRQIGRHSTKAPGEEATDLRQHQMDELIRRSKRLVGSFVPTNLIFGDGHKFDQNQINNSNGAAINNTPSLVPYQVAESNLQDRKEWSAVEVYRAILVGIAEEIRSAQLDGHHFQDLVEVLETLQEKVDILHHGVRTSRGKPLNSVLEECTGAAIMQKSILEAFREILYLHLDLWNYFWRRSQSRADQSFPEFSKAAAVHFGKCCEKLDEARKDLVAEAADTQGRPTMGPIVTRETVLLMLLDRVSKGVHQAGTLDVIDIYEKVVETLATKIEIDASRHLLVTINKTAEELNIVADVLRQQEEVLSLVLVLFAPRKLVTSAEDDRRPEGEASESSAERAKQFRYESKAIGRLIKQTREKITDCEELEARVARLAHQNVQLIETEQEYNNRAILVFTIVTIVFLPLGIVVGFFGMNLKGDFASSRNVAQFWLIAGPVTAGVAIPCLLLAVWPRLVRLYMRIRYLWRPVSVIRTETEQKVGI